MGIAKATFTVGIIASILVSSTRKRCFKMKKRKKWDFSCSRMNTVFLWVGGILSVFEN